MAANRVFSEYRSHIKYATLIIQICIDMNHNRRVTHTSNHVGFGGFSVDVSRFALAGNRPTDDGARENGVQEESRTGE